MRVNLGALSGQLDKGIAPLYFLFGAETLLLEQALDQIRHKAREADYTERLRYQVEAGFDWNLLFASGQSMSLFSDKKLIELRIPTGKPGDAGSKALVDYVATTESADTSLVIISGAIEKRTQGSKWFKAVDAKAITVECPAITADKLPGWIGQRMRSEGLAFDRDVPQRLAHFVEGNLLAAAQEIGLLGLLAENNHVSVELVESSIADHARFSGFSFVDACLAGNAARAIRILQSLEREQSEPILILWSMTRETRTLCQLAALRERGENPQSQFRKFGVWGSRTGLISSALGRLSFHQCQNLLRRLARADQQLKGRAALERHTIWDEIEGIALGLCGLKVV